MGEIISSNVITWERATRIVETNQLGELYRDQRTTDKYRVFKESCIANGESVVQFIVKHRLQWVSNGQVDVQPSSTRLFANENDVCFIPNEFPYNFSKDITHLVVWSKLRIPCDPNSSIGDVSPRTRCVIDKFIHRNFVEQLGMCDEDVLWFRNFPSLQSVVELSHVHVLLRNFPDAFYRAIVNTSGVVLEESEVDEIMNSD
ncbi:Uncharacterized protein YPL067C [Cyberlindnera jadinii]|uniref:Uncharacterized protein YPL067C n=1 Tax=Cyberlindnera jadinii (strain ATCC 18201 / CBS 1600 / BCRC 20928 / JCM 3617 / NBRC 0987 / NRRL Y-1542) TaxID=983966 RepID=A0A0H5C8K1_CYBJN|nr:Uncharacterized protein YPL067C [Cyberlindnera jadinii]